MKSKYWVIGLLILTGCHQATLVDPLAVIQIQDRNGLTETISAPERLQVYNGVDFLTPQPYKKVLRVYKSNGKNASKISTYHPNGNIWQYLEAEEQRAHGAYKEWYPNGQIRIEAYVLGGTADVAPGVQNDWLFDGVSKVWNEKGKPIANILYAQGDLEGISTYFYESGEVEKEIVYHKNVLEGESKEFHKNGKERAKTLYKQGKKEGASTGYFQNGQVAWEEDYREDLLLQGAYFSQQGEMISEVVNGAGFRAIFNQNTGALSMLVQIHQGFAEGGVKQYNAKGDLHSLYHIKNGRKWGEEIVYFSDDKRLPKLSVSWEDNAIHGSVKSWYPSGQMQSQRDFCRNKKSGPSLAWYRDGSLMLVEEYEDDRLVKGQYYKKNALDATSTVLNGTGTATLYDENGIFLRKVSYVKGDPVETEKD